MPSPDLIEAKRVRVTFVCPEKVLETEAEVQPLSKEGDFATTKSSCCGDYSFVTVPCPLCSSFHEVLL